MATSITTIYICDICGHKQDTRIEKIFIEIDICNTCKHKIIGNFLKKPNIVLRYDCKNCNGTGYYKDDYDGYGNLSTNEPCHDCGWPK